jgi:hypothetical protein
MLMTPKWTFAAQKHTFVAQKRLIAQHFSHTNASRLKNHPSRKKTCDQKTAQNPF